MTSPVGAYPYKKDAVAAEPNGKQVSIKKTNKKVPEKVKEALMLPSCMNLNPRSIYNKVKEFITLITEQTIDCVFLSESWERPEFNLSSLLDIEGYTVISNPHQRQGKGGGLPL